MLTTSSSLVPVWEEAMKRASYRRRLSRSIRSDTQPCLVVTGTNNLFARSKRISKNSCQAVRRARVSSTFRAYQIAEAAINLYPACRETRTKQKMVRRMWGGRYISIKRHNLERERRDSRRESYQFTRLNPRQEWLKEASFVVIICIHRYVKPVAWLVNRISTTSIPAMISLAQIIGTHAVRIYQSASCNLENHFYRGAKLML